MKPIVALGVAFAAALSLLATDVADAKRLGGGRSLGTQRQSIAPAPAPSAAAPSGAAANPVMPAQPGVAGARPAPAASGASRWLAPLAGIAAGIGLAALLSHFGLSESFASMLLIGLLVVGAIVAVRFFLARRRMQPSPAIGTATDGFSAAERMPASRERFEPTWGSPTSAALRPFPPGFNPGPFLEQAKLQFRRLQTAYDNADRSALADVMTPQMLAEVVGEMQQRGAHVPTEVVALDAVILEVATEGAQHIASVKFTGLLREDGADSPKPFAEVWNLAKPVDDSSGWLLAGIQQVEEALTLQ
jgi:predicted lipid-binding transport protein (Tim44 family)